jgi:hypothetical protein
MARGWESKSVEEQVADKHENAEKLTAVADGNAKAARKATHDREQQALELQRERILDQRTSNPHRRAALESALADIEARISDLGDSKG